MVVGREELREERKKESAGAVAHGPQKKEESEKSELTLAHPFGSGRLDGKILGGRP